MRLRCKTSTIEWRESSHEERLMHRLDILLPVPRKHPPRLLPTSLLHSSTILRAPFAEMEKWGIRMLLYPSKTVLILLVPSIMDFAHQEAATLQHANHSQTLKTKASCPFVAVPHRPRQKCRLRHPVPYQATAHPHLLPISHRLCQVSLLPILRPKRRKRPNHPLGKSCW